MARQAKESEDFLRRRGTEAPAVIALGFLSAAASALAPLVMVRPTALRDSANPCRLHCWWSRNHLSLMRKGYDCSSFTALGTCSLHTGGWI